jgi:predicted metal-dependent hydrolase
MRKLLIVENPGYTPAHREELVRRLRTVAPVITVRVATRHLEVDVKTEDNVDVVVKKVEKILGGKVLDVVDITFEKVEGGVRRFVELFNAERFWEAHNALEDIWRETRNPTLQGLIMLAAAYVKLQEGSLDKFEKLLQEALSLIQEDVECIKAQEVKRKAEAALLNRSLFKITCP